MAKKFDEEAFYKKYPHVVKGSVKEVEVNELVDGLVVVHSRICKIKCKESGKLRTIHTQDAHQVFYCKEVQEQKVKERLAKKLKSKKDKPKKESVKKESVKKETKSSPKKVEPDKKTQKKTPPTNGTPKRERRKKEVVQEPKLPAPSVLPPPLIS